MVQSFKAINQIGAPFSFQNQQKVDPNEHVYVQATFKGKKNKFNNSNEAW